jgi:RimK family alpha-L-glutamate ligase
MDRFAVVANHATPTNRQLGEVMTPAQAVTFLRPGDVALGRIDVHPSLQGIEAGLWALDLLERRGVTVLNRSQTLMEAHDKLATARALVDAELPHPRTEHFSRHRPEPAVPLPLVVKPRFGSWGRDVMLCGSIDELAEAIARARCRVWFNTSGGVAQELVPPCGFDLRVVVAGGRIIGAATRVAADGEWRTNVALGARRVPTTPPPEARELALAAAAAVNGDLVGVDLLPTPSGWTILEINGAVDFTAAYSLDRDIYSAARAALLGSASRRSVGAPLAAASL